MKTILPFLFAFILVGCTSLQKKPDTTELISIDLEFSNMSVDKGLFTAFLHYAGDSVIKLREGKFPIIGKKEMALIYQSSSDSGLVLKWKPLRAEISMSNDLGYTFGEWELYLKEKDTTLYGNYVSIWKKQADGSWKYILDTGVNTPKPAATQ